jgi:hypothetical protein
MCVVACMYVVDGADPWDFRIRPLLFFERLNGTSRLETNEKSDKTDTRNPITINTSNVFHGISSSGRRGCDVG